MTFLKNHWSLFTIGIGLGAIALIVSIGIYRDSQSGGLEDDSLGVTNLEIARYFGDKGFSFIEDGSGRMGGSLFVGMEKPGYKVLMTSIEGKEELTHLYVWAYSGYDIDPSYFVSILRRIFGECKSCFEWFTYATEELQGRSYREVEKILDAKYIRMKTDSENGIILEMFIGHVDHVPSLVEGN